MEVGEAIVEGARTASTRRRQPGGEGSDRRWCLATTGDGVRPATIRGRGFRQVQREGEEGTEESERGGAGDSERRQGRSPRSRSGGKERSGGASGWMVRVSGVRGSG